MTPQNENFGENFFSSKLPEKYSKSEHSPKKSPKMAQNDQKRTKNENFGQNFFSQKCPKWFKFTQKFTRMTLKWSNGPPK